MSSRVLLVAGAVSYDYLLYPMTLYQSRYPASTADQTHDEVSQLIVRTGDADLVAQLLTAAAPQHGVQVLGPRLQPVESTLFKHNASRVCELGFRDLQLSEPQSYCVERIKRVGWPPTWHSPALETATTTPVTVVITGSGGTFKDIEPALDFLQKARPRHIIYHMTRPLAVGPLWDLIRNGPMTRDGVPDPDFLAVIIDADDLRAEGIPLSQALSWESTAEDFVRNLGSNGRLDTLVTCPNLIVRFGNEGVIYHRGRDAVDPKLYYSPRHMEGEQSARGRPAMLGLASAFTAGLALGFADSKPPNCDKGIRFGLAASTSLRAQGFILNAHDGSPDYPIKQIMENLSLDKQYASVSIPSSRISSGDKWTIFDAVTGDIAELARQIVTLGPKRALAACPIQRFNQLLTVSRLEQESLRAVVDAANERLGSGIPSPTSIGLIGPAGSGKKFTATNVADHIAGVKPVVKLSYNARLLRTEDLVAACHTIRDHTASGALTIVSFENFEAILEAGGEPLDDFLSIMRDGKFADRGQVRNLGSPLMFFVVNQEGTAPTSTPTPMSPTGPSIISAPAKPAFDESLLLDYLHGIVRVPGPNQRSADDKMFCIRRAIMLRHILKHRYPHLKGSNGHIRIEEGVLHALLLVPAYKHGLHSLEKIISTSRLSGRNKFDVAALPPEEQIQLHVDGRIFMSYMRAPKLQPALRERIAQGLFDTYKKQRVEMCKSEEERRALEQDRSMRDWDELSPELKESTRSQADDIPRKLRALRCFMLDQDRGEPFRRVPEFSTEELDFLSEMEHERFNAERLQRQWRMGPRNSKQRTTPFLVPWRDLTQEWKDVDRVMVECVPRILEKNDWKIYRMAEEA